MAVREINTRLVTIRSKTHYKTIEINADLPYPDQLKSVLDAVWSMLETTEYNEMAKSNIRWDIQSNFYPYLTSPKSQTFLSWQELINISLSSIGDRSDMRTSNQCGTMHRQPEYRSNRSVRSEEPGIKLEYRGRVKTLGKDELYDWIVKGVVNDIVSSKRIVDRREISHIENHMDATLEYLVKSPFGTKVVLGEKFNNVAMELVNLSKVTNQSITEMFNDPNNWESQESQPITSTLNLFFTYGEDKVFVEISKLDAVKAINIFLSDKYGIAVPAKDITDLLLFIFAHGNVADYRLTEKLSVTTAQPKA